MLKYKIQLRSAIFCESGIGGTALFQLFFKFGIRLQVGCGDIFERIARETFFLPKDRIKEILGKITVLGLRFECFN